MIEGLVKIAANLPNSYRHPIGDNLIRAALSITNNIAEGNDKVSPKEKARYFHISSDSARECASVLIVLARLELVSEEDADRYKVAIREITSMIRGLLKSLNP